MNGRKALSCLHFVPVALRIGLFGGTFDPPHRGHLAAARAVHERLRLDRTVLMVANDPWQKSGTRDVTRAEIRLQMVREAVAGHQGLEAGDLEIRRGGPSYTADTVAELRSLHPDAEIHVIVGADAALGFAGWVRHEDIARDARLVAMSRPGHHPRLGPEWLTVEVPAVDVSSTDVRRRIALGEDVADELAPGVYRLIVEHGLYAGATNAGDGPR